MFIRNYDVISAFNYQHSVIRPRLGYFYLKQLLDTGLFCGQKCGLYFYFGLGLKAEAMRSYSASINSSQNVTGIDGAREAEGETEGTGKWEDSTELSHGPN